MSQGRRSHVAGSVRAQAATATQTQPKEKPSNAGLDLSTLECEPRPEWEAARRERFDQLTKDAEIVLAWHKKTGQVVTAENVYFAFRSCFGREPTGAEVARVISMAGALHVVLSMEKKGANSPPTKWVEAELKDIHAALCEDSRTTVKHLKKKSEEARRQLIDRVRATFGAGFVDDFALSEATIEKRLNALNRAAKKKV